MNAACVVKPSQIFVALASRRFQDAAPCIHLARDLSYAVRDAAREKRDGALAK